MKTKTTIITLVGTILALGAASSLQANLVTNGNFQTDADGYVGSYYGYGNPPDWTTVNFSTGVNGTDTGFSIFGPANQSADNLGNSIRDYAFLQDQESNGNSTAADSDPILYQSFNVIAGIAYAITFDAASRNYGQASNAIEAIVSDGATPGGPPVLFDQISENSAGAGLYSSGFFSNTSGTYFTTITGTSATTFTADMTGPVTLAFSVVNLTSSPDFTMDVTNIDVETAPEPSTWALVFVGASLLAFFGRRRLV
jgi:hypothetical protein